MVSALPPLSVMSGASWGYAGPAWWSAVCRGGEGAAEGGVQVQDLVGTDELKDPADRGVGGDDAQVGVIGAGVVVCAEQDLVGGGVAVDGVSHVRHDDGDAGADGGREGFGGGGAGGDVEFGGQGDDGWGPLSVQVGLRS